MIKKAIYTILLLSIFISIHTKEVFSSEICCIENQGNFDGDSLDQIDIADLVYLVQYQFNGGPPVSCFDEADIYPISSPDGSIDIADLVAMVNYQFNNGPAPGKCPFLLKFINLNENDEMVTGYANVPDTSIYKVVLWAKTDRWYIQPLISDPYTIIYSNGLWSNSINPWHRLTALLVDTNYIPGSVRDEHPSSDNGVVNWIEYPEKSPDRYINWSNYVWRVKKAELTGPGPNYFSDDSTNVWVDQSENLHLKIDSLNDRWRCTEIVLDQSLGYGLYRFKLNSRVDNLDYNTILGCFIYDTSSQEFDFEFSQRLASPNNAQFVVQPWYLPGNIEFYNMPQESQTSHSFEWRADSIVYKSWIGHGDTATPATLIHSWTYKGSNIPIPSTEHMIFNLYLFGGEPPISGIGNEVIIHSFDYSN